MTMVEGGGDGEVEQWRTWQWTAALTLDVAIDGSGIVGCRWCRRTAMGATGYIISTESGWAREDGDKSSEIFDYSVKPVSIIL